jgi:phosphoribosylamine--glycine ligase
MRVLVIGGGGREHALSWKLAQSDLVNEVFIAPGNPGTAEVGTNVAIPAEDIPALLQFAKEKRIGLTVVGPEAPLVAGIVDAFQAESLTVFGPVAKAASLEGSKDFAKSFMKEFGIPTAAYETFTDLESAVAYVESHGAPLVVKADGLAAGKGVTVAHDIPTALAALRDCFEEKVFGSAGARVVIEDFLEGEEASVLALCDGDRFLMLPSSQDHKPVYDEDKGPNTGGMGAYAPAPIVTPEIAKRVEEEILAPTLAGMKMRGTPYVGVLYAGLMLTQDGPQVVEFNCRMGDPETQPVLSVLESDLAELFIACTRGELSRLEPIAWSERPAVCVVMTAEGYPGSYPKGRKIEGLEEVQGDPDLKVFHAGTAFSPEGQVVTSGGRVLGVTGRGDTIEQAISKAYSGVEKIDFAGAHYRRDIGKKALKLPR